MIARGHRVSFITKDLIGSRRLLGDLPVALFPAPLWRGKVKGLPPVVCYPDILLRTGFMDTDGMVALVEGWMALFRLLAPDLIVAEHSPGALVAARVARLPCVLVGTGFTVPRPAQPFPSITPWQKVEPDRLRSGTDKAREMINRVLVKSGGEPLERLADLFTPHDSVLTTLPELDHYGPRPAASYCGPIMLRSTKPRPQWPQSGGPRIFVYLHAHLPVFPELMRQLAELECAALVVAPDLASSDVKRFQRAHLRLTPEQVDMGMVAEEADAVFNHASHGMVVELLRLGKPPIMLPSYVEQALLAYRVFQRGLGIMAQPSSGGWDYGRLIRRLIGDQAMAAKAAAFAKRYRAFDQNQVLEALAEKLEHLAGS
ncbi:MAG: hypothetical protein C3L25_12545 [Candidatus Sedimenticola endophacoides]|nr:MAG: hypothetical protein B0D94_08780 [Candidatus Sedimenticola endophacoides]OQX38593.1 MAG: hypothetical protein B0D89_12440 [Candidatus Sedimenticola endophacoides]PUD98378.1 MAG: hypothetical protein C3L26_12640 [Candidatus Sedimenticola endophacoides]PUE01336.1 MAG: hypothetical protein C3L25_12545 [Candidatus Sedimenticola endophacoides]